MRVWQRCAVGAAVLCFYKLHFMKSLADVDVAVAVSAVLVWALHVNLHVAILLKRL